MSRNSNAAVLKRITLYPGGNLSVVSSLDDFKPSFKVPITKEELKDQGLAILELAPPPSVDRPSITLVDAQDRKIPVDRAVYSLGRQNGTMRLYIPRAVIGSLGSRGAGAGGQLESLRAKYKENLPISWMVSYKAQLSEDSRTMFYIEGLLTLLNKGDQDVKEAYWEFVNKEAPGGNSDVSNALESAQREQMMNELHKESSRASSDYMMPSAMAMLTSSAPGSAARRSSNQSLGAEYEEMPRSQAKMSRRSLKQAVESKVLGSVALGEATKFALGEALELSQNSMTQKPILDASGFPVSKEYEFETSAPRLPRQPSLRAAVRGYNSDQDDGHSFDSGSVSVIYKFRVPHGSQGAGDSMLPPGQLELRSWTDDDLGKFRLPGITLTDRSRIRPLRLDESEDPSVVKLVGGRDDDLITVTSRATQALQHVPLASKREKRKRWILQKGSIRVINSHAPSPSEKPAVVLVHIPVNAPLDRIVSMGLQEEGASRSGEQSRFKSQYSEADGEIKVWIMVAPGGGMEVLTYTLRLASNEPEPLPVETKLALAPFSQKDLIEQIAARVSGMPSRLSSSASPMPESPQSAQSGEESDSEFEDYHAL